MFVPISQRHVNFCANSLRTFCITDKQALKQRQKGGNNNKCELVENSYNINTATPARFRRS